MLRMIFIITIGLPLVIYYTLKLIYYDKHVSKYSEEERYSLAQRVVYLIMKFGLIKTEIHGTENLPTEGGYIMFPNHQGKFDTLGIIHGHDLPCTVMIDKKRSYSLVVNQFLNIIKASRLDKTSIKNQFETILEVIEQVKNGTRYIIFPEGGYENNGNELQEFLPGAFKCATKSKCPIVPVVLIDSFRVFGIKSIKPIKTKVFFLEPIYYEEYCNMKTADIADRVKTLISEKLSIEKGM